jgi:sulfur carrier protein
VQIWINGVQRELADGARVSDALAVLGVASTGVAVAVDGEVVPRASWPDAVLTEGSRVEILTAVQGG